MFSVRSRAWSLSLAALLCFGGIGRVLAQGKKIVHDAEYYILEAQNGERWAAEDEALDKRLAELREKHGAPPNIIHVMWDDTSYGDVGIPAINKIRGFETPNMRGSPLVRGTPDHGGGRRAPRAANRKCKGGAGCGRPRARSVGARRLNLKRGVSE